MELITATLPNYSVYLKSVKYVIVLIISFAFLPYKEMLSNSDQSSTSCQITQYEPKFKYIAQVIVDQ